MSKEFGDWLQTEEGRRCMSWPVDSPFYLQNRLWWAFVSGQDSMRKPPTPAETVNPAP